jgi:hypothetical protein
MNEKGNQTSMSVSQVVQTNASYIVHPAQLQHHPHWHCVIWNRFLALDQESRKENEIIFVYHCQSLGITSYITVSLLLHGMKVHEIM